MGVQDSSKAIADASLIAPIDGQLLTFRVQEGASVEAYKVLAAIANVNELEISADPNNETLSKLVEGMPVTLMDPNDPTKITPGKSGACPTCRLPIPRPTRCALPWKRRPRKPGIKLGSACKFLPCCATKKMC